jgi:hypothetical protein
MDTYSASRDWFIKPPEQGKPYQATPALNVRFIWGRKSMVYLPPAQQPVRPSLSEFTSSLSLRRAEQSSMSRPTVSSPGVRLNVCHWGAMTTNPSPASLSAMVG